MGSVTEQKKIFIIGILLWVSFVSRKEAKFAKPQLFCQVCTPVGAPQGRASQTNVNRKRARPLFPCHQNLTAGVEQIGCRATSRFLDSPT